MAFYFFFGNATISELNKTNNTHDHYFCSYNLIADCSISAVFLCTIQIFVRPVCLFPFLSDCWHHNVISCYHLSILIWLDEFKTKIPVCKKKSVFVGIVPLNPVCKIIIENIYTYFEYICVITSACLTIIKQFRTVDLLDFRLYCTFVNRMNDLLRIKIL